MNFVVNVANLLLLSSVGSILLEPPNNYRVMKYIADLEKLYKFRTIVLFEMENLSQLEMRNALWNFIQEELHVPVISLTNNSSMKLNKFIGNNAFAIVFIENLPNGILDVVDRSLRGVHYLKIVFIFPTGEFEMSKIKKQFHWCWKAGMVNVNVLVPVDDRKVFIYTYEPFQQNILVNLTMKRVKDFFPNKMKDFKGYKFRSPVKEDMPRVFTYLNETGHKVYDGVGGRIFSAFIKKYNGTFEEFNVFNSGHNVDIGTLFKLIADKKIDISMHPYGNFERDLYGASYPYTLTRYCLIVPVRNQVPPYMYLIKPFKISTWAATICSIFYISTCLFVASVITCGKKDFGHALCNCLCGILNISMPIISFPSSKTSLLIYGQVILLGFILSNLYLTKLFSFLTKPFYGRQLETFDEIYNSGLKILIVEYEIPGIKESINFPEKYGDIFIVADADTVASHFNALNTSYGYAMTTEQWTLYLHQQDYMNQKRFRSTNVCFGQYLVAFPMQFDSPFTDIFGHFIMEIHASGLYHRWEIQIFENTIKAGVLHRLRDTSYSGPIPLTLENLTLMWYIYFYGNLCAICGFLFEHIRLWYLKHYCDSCNKVHLYKCKI